MTWSKKHDVAARLIVEGKFQAVAQDICELSWIKIISKDLKIKWDCPMRLYCDNKSIISIANDPVHHD